MSGDADATSNGLLLLSIRGRMIVVGHHPTKPFALMANLIVRKELEIYGSRASTKQDLIEVIDLVGANKIQPIVEETMPLSQINQAYEKLRTGRNIGRLVLQPLY